jgi:DNA-binding NarL/FixJ family response regulator
VERVSVAIADPQPLFAEALAEAIETIKGMSVVGWATDEKRAERMVLRHLPDVLLCEVALAPGSGLQLARRLRERTRVVVLTRQPEGDVLLDAVGSGALGCLSHAMDVKDVAAATRRAAAGLFAVDEGRIHETLKRLAAARDSATADSAAVGRLTPREREILQLLARGLDNGAIAKQLYLSEHTVRTHVGNLLRKLGAHSRAEAVRVAMSSGEGERAVDVLHIRGPDLRRA